MRGNGKGGRLLPANKFRPITYDVDVLQGEVNLYGFLVDKKPDWFSMLRR